MCGIFGIIDPAGVSSELVRQMSTALRHRGPDDEGHVRFDGQDVEAVGGPDTPQAIYGSGLPFAPNAAEATRVTRPRVVLAHRRLSIIDLAPTGHQPMSFQDRYWIAYNGEVYNYVELRQELTALGYQFRSESDTEVILAAYDRWGSDCLQRFNGMWGLAIVDLHKRTLFLARDRFGVKPLYYTVANGRLAFASEIKALLLANPGQPQANVPRLLDFLVWNLSDHGSETMFQGIVQLLPGHHMTLDLAGPLSGEAGIQPAHLQPVAWYQIHAQVGLDEASGAERLGSALESAVRLRLRADVQVGSCLSGGLDSSSIVCLMSRILKEHTTQAGQKTFTAKSAEPMFDESHHARAVVAASGVDATYITPTADDLMAVLDKLVWHQDEPFISTSIFAQWNVFQAARQAGVTVMLDGQGADESLGGYRGFFGAYLASLARQFKLGTWWREAAAIRREAGYSWLRVLGYTAAYLQPGLIGLLGRFDRRAYGNRSWVHASCQHAFDADPQARLGARASSIVGMSLAQLRATNLPMLLRWEDRNSMAFSVEARVPFLDYRLVELALGLPDSLKVGQGISKRALRQCMRGLVPDSILDRKDKIGFVTSESMWLTRDAAEQTTALLEDSLAALQGIVEPDVLRKDWAAMRAGTAPYDQRIWRVISAGRWVRQFNVRLH